ncbi:NAD(P)/FAD-dependent oxidoreductase [Myxosarcina sp. GI1]|uniref:phytoene desaturase family protein n=1 Tax=Myxosarcina sp. GI1 TaxID=1541065 RepID=UPI00055C3C7B|nr:NAD(P)/FAD-dependent oxidoreductase [Myxosarcina sp. GI1]
MNDSLAADVVIIGSGVGGLCCGALLAKYGFKVIVCESHAIAGGAAHSFERDGYKFDSGPSLYSGMSRSPSNNPLRQVLDVLDEDIEWVNYDVWGCRLPEADFDAYIGANHFTETLAKLRGEAAVAEWQQLQAEMKIFAEAVNALPPLAMRFDLGAAVSMGKYLPSMLWHLPNILKLTRPFSEIIDGTVSDRFIRDWLDLLCFLLSGLPASGTVGAVMAFMFAEWYKPGVELDYPVGGSGAIVDALLRGLTKNGGEILYNSHVAEILVEDKQAVGVRLGNGKKIAASKAVVSNASIWDTLPLIPQGALPQDFVTERQAIPECESFMHLHLGIDGTGLPKNLQCHYIVVNDWEQGVTAPQNVVVASIPSVLDPSLAPAGKHVVHVYTPGNEPYEIWAGLDRRSAEYDRLKTERAEVMWQGLERIIPDIRNRCEVTLVGTPLTHKRYLRRHCGTYGPAIKAGNGLFPGSNTPLSKLYCCGDSTFPGIGIPAVAASGAIAANTIASLKQHLQMLELVT